MINEFVRSKLEGIQIAINGFQAILDLADGDYDYIQFRLDSWKESVAAALKGTGEVPVYVKD